METIYLRFKRPDGSIFNKLTSISQEQIETYKQAGCKLIGNSATPETAPQPVPAEKSTPKKRAANKGNS